MLAFDPEKRAGAHEMLSDPWLGEVMIEGYDDALERALIESKNPTELKQMLAVVTGNFGGDEGREGGGGGLVEKKKKKKKKKKGVGKGIIEVGMGGEDGSEEERMEEDVKEGGEGGIEQGEKVGREEGNQNHISSSSRPNGTTNPNATAAPPTTSTTKTMALPVEVA
jgi:hypothetical protein